MGARRARPHGAALAGAPGARSGPGPAHGGGPVAGGGSAPARNVTVRRADPRPAAVRHNDWRQVELPDPGAFTPTLPVSVIVPCFEAPETLALTLAGLERQAWPRELLEVVVVDDGSDPPLARPARTPLDLKVVRQQRCGFGLARARNTGAAAAAHDILVFLDGDVIPEAGLVLAHARWHHAVSDALTLGFCAYVSVAGIGAGAVRAHRGRLGELFAGRPIDPPWLERHMARTGRSDFPARRPVPRGDRAEFRGSRGRCSRRSAASTRPSPATAGRIPSLAGGHRCAAPCWFRSATPSAGTRAAGRRAGRERSARLPCRRRSWPG